MSIYGPRIRLPRITLPNIRFPKIGLKIIGLILIIILLASTTIFLLSNPINFNNHISISWKNNPLILTNSNTGNSELNITLLNDTKETTKIILDINSESKELIIFCPDKEFPNVAPNHKRETSCIIRRNPNEKIFAGTYQIKIKTNLGETDTTLEIRK